MKKKSMQLMRAYISIPALLLLSIPLQITYAQDTTPHSMTPELIEITAGSFIKGSDQDEREFAYQLDEFAYGHQRTRTGRWYDSEPTKKLTATSHYWISQTPITNQQYQKFIKETGHPSPQVNEANWGEYGFVHSYDSTKRFQWQNNVPPDNREQHPVVLVSYHDAIAYTKWLSEKTGQQWRLPGLDEWERAARGDKGWYFPWGNQFNARHLNSHDEGPFDTQPVGQYPEGASPHGLQDAAGQVFEWIATEENHRQTWLKGGSWDDKGCGVCRPAARHSRPKDIKHILIGFRVVREDSSDL